MVDSELNSDLELINQPAGLTGASGISVVGGWIVSNIIWIIVLIIAIVLSYIVGRLSCKNNKRGILGNILKRIK